MTASTLRFQARAVRLLRVLCGPGLLSVAGVVLVRTVLLPLSLSSWPVGGPPVPDADDAVSGVFAWAALVIATWLTAGTALTALALLPGAIGRGAARLSEALTPALVRRALCLLLGTGVGTVSLPTSPVMASPSVTGGPVATAPAPGSAPTAVAPRADPAPAPAPDPRWRPSRPVRAEDPQAAALLAPAPRTSSVPDDVVTVRRGDSLWSLAARHLGPGASDREIALTWPQWYAANAELIGPDPDLIRPGQQLRIPTVGGH